MGFSQHIPLKKLNRKLYRLQLWKIAIISFNSHYILLLTPPIKDMTTSNAKDAAVTDTGLRKASKADQCSNKGGSATPSDDPDAAKTNKPPKLTGKIIFIKIKPIIAPQRIKL